MTQHTKMRLTDWLNERKLRIEIKVYQQKLKGSKKAHTQRKIKEEFRFFLFFGIRYRFITSTRSFLTGNIVKHLILYSRARYLRKYSLYINYTLWIWVAAFRFRFGVVCVFLQRKRITVIILVLLCAVRWWY